MNSIAASSCGRLSSDNRQRGIENAARSSFAMSATPMKSMSNAANGVPWASRLSAEIGKAVLGQLSIIERLQIALLTGGHVLLEGMPGLAKTLLVNSLARALGAEFER